MAENKTKLILDTLEPLFKEAEQENLWFYSNYQDMWFSPEELRKQHANGKFVWGATNWTLRSPYEKLEQLENLKANIDKNIQEFKARVNKIPTYDFK